MKELSLDFPSGLEYKIVSDPTRFVRSSIEAVIHTLLEAIALVVIVVIVFPANMACIHHSIIGSSGVYCWYIFAPSRIWLLD